MIKDSKHTPIFVTGIERSGSSIIAKVIQACGVYTGKTTVMMENIQISSLVDSYYKEHDWDKLGQFPLPNTNDILIPTTWKDKVESFIPGNKVWMYKDKRLGHIWPIWNHAFPTAKWIIVRRRTGDVIESCQKTAYMAAYEDKKVLQQIGVKDDREGWLWWIHQQEQLYRDMIESGVNCKVIWPGRILDGDYSQIFEMIDWLGLKWNAKIMVVLNDALLKQ